MERRDHYNGTVDAGLAGIPLFRQDIETMKIAMVLPWFPSLDARTVEAQQGVFDFRQTMQLAERGHEFKIISVRWRGQSSAESFGDRVAVRRLSPLFIFPKIRYPVPELFSFSRAIKKLCRDWRPDVLYYSHAIYLTALPVLWLRKTGIPVIAGTDALPGVAWFYGSRLVDLAGRLYTKLVLKRILNLADGVHLMSSQLMKQGESIGLDKTKAFTITRGVDTAVFHPAPPPAGLRESLGIGERDTVVLYAGRLDLVKGVGYLLRAAARVLPRRPAVKVLIVGEGSLRKQYEAYAAPLSPAVIFAGWRKDIPRLMNAADIFVLPSLSEGAANVAMEAGASGLPVIASAVGEIPHIIVPGLTGELVAPGDVDGLAAALEKLLDSPALARQMGEAARKRMAEKYTWNIICEAVAGEYGQVIDRFSRAGERQ
ncbi:MAG: glycosyltransferase [Dehalococcoidales bacterium]